MADTPEHEPVSHPLPFEWLIPTAVRWEGEMRLHDKPETVDWVEYIETRSSGGA